VKKQASLLLGKSLDSLVLSIEHFNRPWDRGRPEAVLILLDRSFELLLKAAILHKGGKIREPYGRETIGFDKCVRKCLTDAKVTCISEEEGLSMQNINSLRDAAQHDIVELSEQELYMYSQAGVTVYRDILERVFNEKLSSHLPARVLPVSTDPPKDLHTMIDADFADIRALLQPNRRRQIEAKAKLKALAIVEASLQGVRSQPGDSEVNLLARKVQSGTEWQEIFPGVASLELSSEGTGIGVQLRIVKKEGEKVQLVAEGTPGATVLAVKRVNELDYYSLGLRELGHKLGLGQNHALALVKHLHIQDDDDCYKEIAVGRSKFKRYSPAALDRMKRALPETDMTAVWEDNKPTGRKA
jgi:hypothetical protein